MKKLIFFLFFIIFFTVSIAQSFTPVTEGSKIHFVIKNFGINTGGDLSGIKGSIVFLESDLNQSDFNVSVDVNTIDTDNSTRDDHLKSDDYFDAEKYSSIIIKSSKIEKANTNVEGNYIFSGTLTMHGQTKNISFPFNAKLQGNDYLFSGEFEIDRVEYGVGENSAVMSKTVHVSLSVLARKN